VTGPTRHARRRRRNRIILVLGTIALCAGGFLLVVGFNRGVDGLVRLFTSAWLESPTSGRKFTPTGAVRRAIEKMSEKREDEGGR